MLVNASYNDKELSRKINEAVGLPYTLLERWKMNGIGSPKLWINSASSEIFELLSMDKYNNTCNVEIRPKGIIVRFRSILETFALVIPFYHLTIFKGKSDEISMYSGHHTIRVRAKDKKIHDFFHRLLLLKMESSGDQHPSME